MYVCMYGQTNERLCKYYIELLHPTSATKVKADNHEGKDVIEPDVIKHRVRWKTFAEINFEKRHRQIISN